MSENKTTFKARVIAETKTLVFIFIYLAVLLGTLTTYRRVLLAEYRVPFFHYGYAIVEALILAKVILIGRWLHIGERLNKYPLIVPTLYKTFCFSLFVLVFAVLEHVIDGLWHKDSFSTIFDNIIHTSQWEILAGVLVLFMALAPLFAMWEIEGALGQGKLLELFFKRRTGA